MTAIQHIVLTRFAVKFHTVDGARVAPAGPAPLSPDWLAQRFALFETYLLPSMQAQTFTDFVWRIYVHPDFDPRLADRLRAYDARIRVVTDPVSPLPVSAGLLASTRIDSDDGFASTALEMVQRYAERFASGTQSAQLLRLKQGWWVDHQAQRAYQCRGWSFLTLFERRAPYRGALAMSCDDIAKSYPEWTESHPSWVRIVHGGNIRNRFDQVQRTIPVQQLRNQGFGWLAPSEPAPVPDGPDVDDDPSVDPRIALVMRTTDRRRVARPVHANYVKGTVAQLIKQGVTDLRLQLSKRTDIDWIVRELGPDLYGQVQTLAPPEDLSANATALAGLASVDLEAVDWVLLLEDDLTFCRDFVGSVQRWLVAHGRADRHVFRFFGFFPPPRRTVSAFDHPLPKLVASQAIALRVADARDFLAWGYKHLHTWRGRDPGHADPGVAFDKFVATWAIAQWPNCPGVLSWPFFVDHIGDQSSLHRIGGMNHAGFAGTRWSFPPTQAPIIAADRVVRDWPESTVFCLGGGTITPAEVEAIRGAGRVIAVNDAYRLAPWADALYAADRTWWHHHRGVPDFTGEKYGMRSKVATERDRPFPDGVRVLHHAARAGLSDDPSTLYIGGSGESNSGHQAIGLAVLKGARRIILLGYDLQLLANGRAHWFGDHPVAIRQRSNYLAYRKPFATLVEPLQARGITLLNASSHTALTCFPRVTLADVLATEAVA